MLIRSLGAFCGAQRIILTLFGRVPFVFVTGYDKGRILDGYRVFPVLQKPFHRSELSDILAKPFGAEMCDVVMELKPEVVSFHFGVPERSLVDRLKDAGCVILSSATTVTEARWLEECEIASKSGRDFTPIDS
jgi:hypothetical protein